MMDAEDVDLTVVDVSSCDDRMSAGIVRAAISSGPGDMIVSVGIDGTSAEEALEVILHEDATKRANLLKINNNTTFRSLVNELIARTERFGRIQVMFLVREIPHVFSDWKLHMYGKDMDGDALVTWPEGDKFWETNDYTPFKNRAHMLSTHKKELQSYMEQYPRDRIYMNVGADFMHEYPDMPKAMVRVPHGILERNLGARATAQKTGKLKEGAQPIELHSSYENQQFMEDEARRLRIPIFNGFDEIAQKQPNLSGLIVATSGAGKSTFVDSQTYDVAVDEVPRIFMNAYSEKKNAIKNSLHTMSEEKWSMGENRPMYTLVEGMKYLGSEPWIKLLERANDVFFNQGRQSEKTFTELQKKAGACGVLQCPDKSLIRFDPVLKDFDPLAVQIGKITNKLVAFNVDNIMTQRDSGIFGQQDSYTDELYPEEFSQMYMYAMSGSGPWDNTKSVWHGIVPQMVNMTVGVWEGMLLSTSPFGLLYSTMPVTSVVPLFPQLLNKFHPKGLRLRGLVTELDAKMGYSFLAQDGQVRDWEWVFSESTYYSAGSGHIVIENQRRNNTKIYNVEVVGEKYYSTHDLEPHVTFDAAVQIADGTVLPIRRIEQRDGTRVAYVQVDGVNGHVTLGLPPVYAGDRALVFESLEEKTGKEVYLKTKKSIKASDVIFRCGERVNEGLPFYFNMVNRALMGTGKLQQRMSIRDIVTKVRLRVNDGIDRSGHVLLAANLPILQQHVFMASVVANMALIFDARGIYQWEGLPLGRWHTVDDYRSAVDFGLSEGRVLQLREQALTTFKEFFETIGQYDFNDGASSPYYLTCCHSLLDDMFS